MNLHFDIDHKIATKPLTKHSGSWSLSSSSHLSLNREGRWGTTDDFATSFLWLKIMHHQNEFGCNNYMLKNMNWTKHKHTRTHTHTHTYIYIYIYTYLRNKKSYRKTKGKQKTGKEQKTTKKPTQKKRTFYSKNH